MGRMRGEDGGGEGAVLSRPFSKLGFVSYSQLATIY
jgi:hypothetical protein